MRISVSTHRVEPLGCSTTDDRRPAPREGTAVASPVVQLEEFDYELPPERIAQTPVEPRDSARLLVDRGDREPDHRRVSDLPDLLQPGDLLVVNETRVLPSRLRLRRATGGAAEVLLLDPLDERWSRWTALARPGQRLRHGEELLASTSLEPVVRIVERVDDQFVVELCADPSGADDALGVLGRYGEIPLPPYVVEPLADTERYQTVYASTPGSAAAPTAGLHLTRQVLRRLHERDIGLATVELVVGVDTFRPITVDDPRQHPMHSERYRVPEATLQACRDTAAGGGRVVAVGTTAVRALESAAATGELSGRTTLFIHRGYHWRIVDLLMTNFHLPRTTLLMMIDAFCGPRWRRLYATALSGDYRFLSFGDAMLLDRHAGGNASA